MASFLPGMVRKFLGDLSHSFRIQNIDYLSSEFLDRFYFLSERLNVIFFINNANY